MFVTLTHTLALFCQYFHHSSFALEHCLFFYHFCSYSTTLVLSRYFFYVTFTVVLFLIHMLLYKRYRFEIYLSVFWKSSFIVLPLFTKQDGAVVVAQLAVRSILTPEISSNLVIGNFIYHQMYKICCVEKIKIKKKRPGLVQFLKHVKSA